MGRKRKEKPLTEEEKAFYAGFVDCTSAGDCQRSRNAFLESAINDVRWALGQHRRYEQKLGVELPTQRARLQEALEALQAAREVMLQH